MKKSLVSVILPYYKKEKYVYETIKSIEIAQANNISTIISHRSGETEDTIIADLSVGIKSKQIKTGSVSRTDRTAKYNQLLRIEEELKEKGKYSGSKIIKMIKDV